MRFAVIGSGVSGIAAAKVLARLGHEIVVLEKAKRIGGVWTTTYSEVRLQNIGAHYRFTDFDWPFLVDEHPTAPQVLDYLEAAVAHFGLDIRLEHDVKAMREQPNGWRLEIATPEGMRTEDFDYVIVAAGLFSGDHADSGLAGIEAFGGRVLSERTLDDPSVFKGQRVAVIGFGKTALDLASMAAAHGGKVRHVFRAPRWLLPRRILGRNFADIAAARMSATMLPSWAHPERGEARLHRHFGWMVKLYWKETEWLFRAVLGLHPFYLRKQVRRHMAALTPKQPLTYQMRAAAALAPDDYYALVRKGTILPHCGDVAGLSKTGLILADGSEIDADIVIAALGYKAPEFGFLPPRYRALMTGEADGCQLYRHVLHPRIPRVAFAGFNHCYLHAAGVEIAMVWYEAVISGRLQLPTEEKMAASAARVAEWKRRNSLFEPVRAYGVGARFFHHLDVLLTEIGLDPHRKSDRLSDFVTPYFPKDYRGIFDEYTALASKNRVVRTSLDIDA